MEKQFANILREPFARLGLHDQYDWVKLPWDGVFNKVLYMDRVTGATMELAHVKKGYVFPEHYHTCVQFMVSGHLETNDTKILPGTFNVIPTGKLHGPFHAVEDSIQFKYFSSVPVYILSDGRCFIYKENGTTMDAGILGREVQDNLSLTNFIQEFVKN
jgi:hypothetical protein